MFIDYLLNWYSFEDLKRSHLNGKRALNERQANEEETVSERCLDAKWNLLIWFWTITGEHKLSVTGALW